VVRTSASDRGQAAVAVLLLATALSVAVSAALVDVGGRMIDRARAQTAADAAALAAVTGGRGDAVSLAEQHGATLVSFARGPGAGDVTVMVRLGSATARAAATDDS
jgi:hypothetical protein